MKMVTFGWKDESGAQKRRTAVIGVAMPRDRVLEFVKDLVEPFIPEAQDIRVLSLRELGPVHVLKDSAT